MAAAAIPAPRCYVSQPVSLGSTGLPALCVETRLLQLLPDVVGFVPDAFFDGAAKGLVRAFQYRQGMSVTGAADQATLVRMGIWRAASAMPTPVCRIWSSVRLGSTGRPAKCVETRLQQLGFAVTPDALFDGASVGLVRAFQYRQGLPVTGVADGATLSRMGILAARPAQPAPTCTVSMEVSASTPGRVAKCLETRLVQLGYSLNGPNDAFDGTAVGALRAFQYWEGLPVTGRADMVTLQRLSVWRTPAPLPAPTCRVHYDVRIWALGSEAQCLERRLQQLGFNVGQVDQMFDATSYAGLRWFQYNNGLPLTGVANQATLQRLGIYSSTPVSSASTYLPANSGSGRRIVYSRSQQRIWVVEANGTVIKTHRVSGRTYEPYAGTYYVYSRSEYTYSANDPSVRWRYMIRFTYGPQGGRIGFHEIPNRNGVPLQSAEQLGLPLSGGCVRQSTPDARWLWSWAYVGTKVVVL